MDVALARDAWYHRGMDHASGDAERADRLAHFALRSVNRAVRRYALFAPGERVLLCVSGGKDSMTMLDLLHRRQRLVPEPLDLAVGVARPDMGCGRAVPFSWLAEWCAARHLPLHSVPLTIRSEVEAAGPRACFRCSWLRRKALFELADRTGCHTLAMAHHADDAAETALLNLLCNATVGGLAPVTSFFGGRLRLVRPLIMLEERDIVSFARASGYPLRGEPCPHGQRSKRAAARRLLHAMHEEFPNARRYICRAHERLVERQREESTRA